MNDHFNPVAKPAPPRPRWPDAFISLTSQSRPLSRIALVPSQAPRARAPARPQSPWPYRLRKIRSLSSSMFWSAFGERCQRGRPAHRRGELAVDLGTGLGRAAGRKVVEDFLEGLRCEILVVIVIDLHRG